MNLKVTLTLTVIATLIILSAGCIDNSINQNIPIEVKDDIYSEHISINVDASAIDRQATIERYQQRRNKSLIPILITNTNQSDIIKSGSGIATCITGDTNWSSTTFVTVTNPDYHNNSEGWTGGLMSTVKGAGVHFTYSGALRNII